MTNNKKPKLISIFKKSGIGIIKPVTYATKTSAIDYVKFSTQQTINGTPPGNLPNPEVEPVGNFIVAENINMLLTENNNNLVIE
jgi:hypothetical protein